VSDKSVEAIVVAFNSLRWIDACLKALPAAAGRVQLRITVVDNASDMSVTGAVEKSGIPARVLTMDGNLGYAGANNSAIRSILSGRETPPHAVLILNPDVVMPPGSIERLLGLLLASDSCGAVSPRVAGSDIFRPIWGWPRARFTANGETVEVDRLPGCCLLIKPELFQRAGLFDEAYFLYWEEIDFGLRACAAGYRLLIHTRVAAVHAEGANQAHRAYYMCRNQFRFGFKNYGRMKGLVFLVRRLLVTNLREIATHPALLRPSLAGLAAGLRGETGRSASAYATPE
jgi:N-acetylglucosaminyl-diphospho-decaprenol L-rhamnosyltransferase